jgi:hypothetical protein
MPNTDHQDAGDHDHGRDRERQRVETSDAAKLVHAEILAMHEFFVKWFRGAVTNDDDVFSQGFARRFDPGFMLIGTGGEILPLARLTKLIRAGHGSNPGFRIEIREVVLRRELDSVYVVTFEEWQRNAMHATPNNGRLNTALLQMDRVAPGGLAWLHMHECWLPSAVVAAERFEF